MVHGLVLAVLSSWAGNFTLRVFLSTQLQQKNGYHQIIVGSARGHLIQTYGVLLYSVMLQIIELIACRDKTSGLLSSLS